jgi:RimJ/RimL family protein N-acetyltransferase
VKRGQTRQLRSTRATLAPVATTVLETERLRLRRLTLEDAPFILQLVNEPSWLRFIGDRGVRTLEDAQGYILKGPLTSYDQFGFGLYLAELKDSGIPIGMCGLLKRETLPDPDVGYALLPGFWGKGYASEAASAVLDYGRSTFGLTRILAIVTPDNHGSIRVLEKLGLRFQEMVKLSEEEPELALFAGPQ